jgi:signal transduction histidine kinase
LAILFPSLVVGYLSFKTFSEKQKAVQNLLESNLWISGESALKAIENELVGLEESILKKENFENSLRSMYATSRSEGRSFLLDDNLKIIIPLIARLDISHMEGGRDFQDSSFSQAYRAAETVEFVQRDYSRAIEGYRKCSSIAVLDHQNAMALEAIGRCYLALKKYDDAQETYSELAADYSQILNKAGHPYGLTANLQLFDLMKHVDISDGDKGILLRLYENLQNGEYPVTLPVYKFFRNEIRELLDMELENSNFQPKSSPYLETLLFADFLEREAIPKMTERGSLNRLREVNSTGRFFAEDGEKDCFVSYCAFPEFMDKKTFYGGLCWDLDFLKRDVLPGMLGDLEKNLKLHLRIIDNKNLNVLTGNEESISNEALSLSFRQFPLPWSLMVTQPALDDVLRTTRRDNVFYGVLLGFVVVLMVLGAILIARDISRESETTRLKTEFVHHVSHELKTPLTLIRLYGETLQRKKNLAKSEQTEAYEIITKESERLSYLINNVLDFSRIEMGKKEFDFKKGDLVSVIRDTLDSYRYHLEKKGFLIREDIATDLPIVMFDEEGIASILINLLSNAIKFSPTKKEVTVRLFQRDDHVILQVEDKGIGISSKEIPRVFEKFYRSGDVKAADAKGSGLGLTLVKHITEAHRGQVEVKSEPGQGSTFSILFPISDSQQG